MLPVLKIGATILLWCWSNAAFAQDARNTPPGTPPVIAPVAATSPACKGPTSEPACFNVKELPDRIIFCANIGKYYVFFQELPTELDQYCFSAAKLRAAVDLPLAHYWRRLLLRKAEKKDYPTYNDAKKIKELIEHNDAVFMAGEKQNCNAEARKKFGSRIAGIQDVNTVIVDPRVRPGRGPIGMIGAIFCDPLEIVGIDITRSLVFDYSVFLNPVLFSSITASANLSFNKTSLLQELKVFRSRIAGGLFVNNALMNTLVIIQSNIGLNIDISDMLVFGGVSILQTKVGDTVNFRGSTFGQLKFVDSEAGADISLKETTVLGFTHINRSRFAGSLNAPGAAFSELEILYNKFATNVNLQTIGARCGINLSNNTIGNDLTLSKVNLGKTFTNNSHPHRVQYRWSDPELKAIRKQLNVSPEDIIKSQANDVLGPKLNALLNLAEQSDCPLITMEPVQLVQALRINDNRVEKNICLNEFEFSQEQASTDLAVDARVQRGGSILVSLSGSSAQGTAFLSFWPTKPVPSRTADARLALPSYVIDLVGFQTGALVPLLKTEYERIFRLLTTGIRFDRIFANTGRCGFVPNSTDSNTGGNSIESAGLKLPTIGSLLSWLSRADTTQPYTAAIAALDRAGVNATDLKIQKAHFEFISDTDEKWNETVREWRNRKGFLTWISLPDVGRLWDWLRLIATGMLGWVADYGYRPQKAILYVAAAVLGFTLLISKILKVRWAATDVQNRVVPVGWVFVLDYMIPAYNIDAAHFKVREFRFENGVPIDADTERHLQHTLRWIRVTGAVAVVFVLAVFKTLVVG